ncbi:MAG: hypothetical protein JWO78_464 [Micavibrio sp.]|nr:hypothetical protein [Micavibrio sp.]
MTVKNIVLVSFACVTLAGCSSTSTTSDRAIMGGALGLGIGAAFGNVGGALAGAAIGAGVGAATSSH